MQRVRYLPGLLLPLALTALITNDARPQAAAPAAPVVNPEDLPKQSPTWLDGYKLRMPLRVVIDPAASKSQTVTARLPMGSWLKPDASDLAIQTAAGQVIPVAVLSHCPTGDTLIQFKRNANDRWYWAYAVGKPGAKADPLPEGLTLELRDWAGTDLGNWPAVLEGLKKSEKVIGNAFVGRVIHNCNPVRPDDPKKFAASYRGTLTIPKDGTYRLFVNSDDASFLFIDGFKVVERTGTNNRMVGQIPLRSVGADVDLKAGTHPFEVHHVMGNSPAALGYCTLIWIQPGQKAWGFVTAADMVQPLYAEVAGLEQQGGAPVATFGAGVDDTLNTGGVFLHLVRFEAQGTVLGPPEKLQWDFGDGTTGTGPSAMHVYFKGGSYKVTLKSSDGLPPFQRTVHVWTAPIPTSPFSLATAVKALGQTDWRKLDPERVNQIFDFLSVCEQPGRWPLVEAVCRHLLALPNQDPKQRALLYASLMEAMAEQGHGREALQLVEPALKELSKVPSQQVGIKLAQAQVLARHLKEPTEASRIYQNILEEYRRLDHPNLRLAAIRWGDLFADAGQLGKAAETYRMAATVGSDRNQPTAQTEAITRGARLRIAEQRLRSHDIRQTRFLLERIEIDYPEQKLEGLYRFLRAEADRYGGRYEEAIRNYEFLLKLTQWAGYRDRALHGIADCYYRMADYDKALDWLSTVKESFPPYFEKHKLAATQKLIEGRLARIKAAEKQGSTGAVVLFEGLRTSFEPGEKLPTHEEAYCRTVLSLGFGGSHDLVATPWPVAPFNTSTLKYTLPNITPGGLYWVEYWYRMNFENSNIPHLVAPQQQIIFYEAGTPNSNPEGGAIYFHPEMTWGNWRKMACIIKAPMGQDGQLAIFENYNQGLLQMDSLSVLPISDRQNDTLQTFIEGGGDKP
jgi:tetratricopeptide (TPR) repeat protein